MCRTESNNLWIDTFLKYWRMLTKIDYVLYYKNVSKISNSISLPGKNFHREIITLPYIIYHLTYLVFAHTCVCMHTKCTYLRRTESESFLRNKGFFPVCSRYRLIWFTARVLLFSLCFWAVHQKGGVGNICYSLSMNEICELSVGPQLKALVARMKWRTVDKNMSS